MQSNPYPQMNTNMVNHSRDWVETTAETFNDQLGAVPPIRFRENAFLVGECYIHTEHGAIHAAFVVVKERYFGRLEYLHQFDPARYEREIRKQFGM